jgi:aspartyl/glutamyl-tRNA(Asn/Gln) amidotransferase, C subunit
MPQVISEDEVKKISQLARLGLSDAEVKQATQDLAGVLEHFSSIQKIDTQNVPEYSDATGLQNVSRNDIADQEDLCSSEDLLSRAPATSSHKVKVKNVF